jgi:hypothetical protein
MMIMLDACGKKLQDWPSFKNDRQSDTRMSGRVIACLVPRCLHPHDTILPGTVLPTHAIISTCATLPGAIASDWARKLKIKEEAMTFVGVNYLAIVIAAVAAWFAGSVWYMFFGKTWMAALAMTPEKMQATSAAGAYSPFILAFVAELVMAWTLAGLLFRSGPLTVQSGIISGALCWFGFVLTAMLVNNGFAKRDRRLILIDGGHWLLVLLLMGAIIGAMRV